MDVLQKITIEVRGEPPTPVDGEWLQSLGRDLRSEIAALGTRLSEQYGVLVVPSIETGS